MSTDIPDHYEAYYAEKLWALLPEIYRAEDSSSFDVKGPLREIVDRVGVQAAILRRSVDRLWEDQSIETCDDWVIPYLGDLLATNLVAGLDGRGRRLDVANTIFYRRRKGTVAVLEQIAADITGWNARVVEFFRRMARSRHNLDPAIGWPADAPDPDLARQLQEAQGLVGRATRTHIGGFADLRNVHGASLAHTAFDELFHTGDVRLGRGQTGWHNISHLGVFLWRLKSVPVGLVTGDTSTPVLVADPSCKNEYTFDPTGRYIPLFADLDRTYGDEWISSLEHQVPGPISVGLLQTAFTQVPRALYPDSIRLYLGGAANPIDADDVTADPAEVDVTNPNPRNLIDPERGRAVLTAATVANLLLNKQELRVGYHYGFSSNIGAGGYDRRVRGQAPVVPTVTWSGGVTTALGPSDTLVIADSLTYTSVPDYTVQKLTLRADNLRRSVIRLPKGSPPTTWTFTGNAGAQLVIDGLLISGGEILLDKKFESVTIVTSTLDPGDLDPLTTLFVDAADDRPLVPCKLRITAQIDHLVIDRSITGPILVEGPTGFVARLTIRDSIVHSLIEKVPAIDAPETAAEIQRSTILGKVSVHHIEADAAILHDVTTVADNQQGCVRFSAWSTGSFLPKRYESVEIDPGTPLFTSLRFGHPGYAQLTATSGPIAEGADDGSEMGAFSREKNAIKERGLRIKYKEYMPFGLALVIVYVT